MLTKSFQLISITHLAKYGESAYVWIFARFVNFATVRPVSIYAESMLCPLAGCTIIDLPRCIAGVCECQIACAQLIEHAQNAQTGADRMATLDANQAGDFARAMSLLDASCAGDQGHVMWIELHQSSYQIDLFQRQLHRIQMLRGAWSVGGPELC